jgi:hypothetical protein
MHTADAGAGSAARARTRTLTFWMRALRVDMSNLPSSSLRNKHKNRHVG